MAEDKKEPKFKADIQKGMKEFDKVEKDFLEFERKTKNAFFVSQDAMNKTITL